MKKILFICIYLCACVSLNAQDIKGKFVDKNGQPLSYVSVTLTSESDSVLCNRTVSDSTGYFVFKDILSGGYIMSASSIGYIKTEQRLTMVNGDIDAGQIVLLDDTKLLGEVTVKGSSFIRKSDRVIIIPGKQQVKHSVTGYDLLYNLMIPGIDVDRSNGNVSSATGGVSLYIDGRKVDYREVQGLRPTDVAKVEYMDAPTGKYAGDNIAVNYITKQYTSGGYVQADAKQTVGYMGGDYNAVAKLQCKTTSLTLFAGHGMKEHGGDRTYSNDVIHFANGDLTRNIATTDARMKNNSQYTQLNILNNNGKRTLMAKMAMVREESPDNFMEQSRMYGGIYNYENTSRSDTYQKGIKPSLNLYGYFNTTQNQYLEACITGTYSNNKYDYRYGEAEGLITSQSKEKLYTVMAQFSYGINLKRQNSLKFNLYHFHQVSSTDYSGTTDSWQHLWSGETLFFAAYSKRFGKSMLYFEPGISQQLYRLHGEKIVKNTSPRLHLRYSTSPAKNHFLQISSAVGNSFPQINMVNSTEQAKDMIEIRRGNPEMNSAKLYNVTAVYSINSGRINTQAVWINNFFKDVPYIDYFIEGSKLIGMYNNNISIYTSMAFISATWKASDKLNMQLNGSYQHKEVSRGVRKFVNGWKCGANVNYYLGDFSFNLYASTESHELNEADMSDVYLPSKYGMTLNYAHGNWRIQLNVNNAFSNNVKIKNLRSLGCYAFNSQIYSKTSQAMASIKLAYTFDYGKKTEREQNSVDRTINSAILKAN